MLKFKNTKWILTCLVFFAVYQATQADSGSLLVETRFISSYFWRGWIINDDPCFQPSLTLSRADFSLNTWGSWDIEPDSNSPRRTRVDLTADYTTILGKHIFGAGIIGYFYQDKPTAHAQETAELFLEYAFNTRLLPSITFYYDIDEINAYYGLISLYHGIELIKDSAVLDIQLSVGGGSEKYADALWNFGVDADDKEIFEPDGETLMDLTINVSLPIFLRRNIELVPSVQYMKILNPEAADTAQNTGNDTDKLAFAISCVAGF